MQGKSNIISFDYQQMDMHAQKYCVRGVLKNGIYIIRFHCAEYFDAELKKIADKNCKLSASQSSTLTQIIDRVLAAPEKRDPSDIYQLDGFIGWLVVNFDDGTDRTRSDEAISEIYRYLASNANTYTFTDESLDYVGKKVYGGFDDEELDYSGFDVGTSDNGGASDFSWDDFS